MPKAKRYTDGDRVILRQAFDGTISVADAAQAAGVSPDTVHRYWKRVGWEAPPEPMPDAVVPENSRWLRIAFNATGRGWVLAADAPYDISDAMRRAEHGLGFCLTRRANGGRELVYTDRKRK